MKMIRKLICFSCLVIGVLFSASFAVMAEGEIIPQGCILIKGSDGMIRVGFECMQAKLAAGNLTAVKNTLDAAVIDDEQKDKELREILASKLSEAEQAYNNYVTKKEVADKDIQKLKEAQQSIEKANEIWTDNFSYEEELKELERLILIVESGGYEKEQAKIKEELTRDRAEEEIHKLIKEAQFCEVDSDCMRPGFGCPFGCGTVINKSMLEQITIKVDAYMKNYDMCMYDCYAPASLKVKCIDNKCALQR